MNILDVSGKILTVYGTRRVRVVTDGTVDRVAPFVVADVTRPIVSLGKLTKQDFSVHLERQASRIERGGRKASLIARRNTSTSTCSSPQMEPEPALASQTRPPEQCRTCPR